VGAGAGPGRLFSAFWMGLSHTVSPMSVQMASLESLLMRFVPSLSVLGLAFALALVLAAFQAVIASAPLPSPLLLPASLLGVLRPLDRRHWGPISIPLSLSGPPLSWSAPL